MDFYADLFSIESGLSFPWTGMMYLLMMDHTLDQLELMCAFRESDL